MPLVYKCDILKSLNRAGYSSYTLRDKHLLSGSTIQKLRDKQSISWSNLEQLCRLLDCQPGDIIEFLTEAKDSNE